MKRFIFAVLFSANLSIGTAIAQNDSIETDILMEKITTLISANKHAEAIRYFKELEALGTPLPEIFYYFYIDALDKSGDIETTVQRCKLFLEQFGKKSKYYANVVSIVSRNLIELEKSLAIGKKYGGGIIFFVDETGLPGLIAALSDLPGKFEWKNAINAAAGSNEGGFNDWRLPTKQELQLLYDKKNVVGGFTDAYYWSSTEYVANGPWIQGFKFGYQYYSEEYYARRVRAIRAF